MTPSLRELQQAFADAVFDETSAVPAHVRDGIFPAARHLQIYRHNTFSNLTDALAAVYPVVQRLVGTGFFDYAVDSFIKQHPPRSGNLHDFGKMLADFLEIFEPARTLPYLPDMARLEWAWHQSFHAADQNKNRTSDHIETLGTVAAERYNDIVFHLHPSVHLVSSSYPVLRIWQVNQPDFNHDTSINLDEGGQRVLVARRGIDVYMNPSGLGEHALLQAFLEQKPLGQAVQNALTADPNFDFGTALHHHIAAGVITGFSIAFQE